MTPLICDYPRYVWQLVNRFRITHERFIAQKRENDLSQFEFKKRAGRILELANGRLRAEYKILRAQEYCVYGIDMAPQFIPCRSSSNSAVPLLQHRRATHTILSRTFYILAIIIFLPVVPPYSLLDQLQHAWVGTLPIVLLYTILTVEILRRAPMKIAN